MSTELQVEQEDGSFAPVKTEPLVGFYWFRSQDGWVVAELREEYFFADEQKRLRLFFTNGAMIANPGAFLGTDLLRGPIKPPEQSWKVEVHTTGDPAGAWSSNELRFGSLAEAEAYGRNLARRWTAVEDWRTVECAEPVNYRMHEEGAVRIG